ncbi:helix-turn-helix transcriptional regulator [Phenylobacterium sp.]|uniref:helix-turn-helix domain-containing protein n=1 Tax=Phenylobacterium sp. TaxID=1871053 RepID=UPI002B9B3934|nr:helix-turn-helix transcriptional regulator [Phenylobacterium sp.]HLZ75043.1 helix-turn-helix transcriptional regulator [Phenylobacterium sp.]
MEAHPAYAPALPSAVSDLRAANDAPKLRLRPAPITPATTQMIQQRLGKAIRIRRRMMDLTLQDLAGACGVTFQQVHKYESGLCSMSASQLWCVAVALNVPVSYFYDTLATPELMVPADEYDEDLD